MLQQIYKIRSFHYLRQKGINPEAFGSKDALIFSLAGMTIKDVDPGGKFDLIAHGTADEMEVEHNGNKIMINSRTAARLIKDMPGYKEGQPIRLLSCNVGARGNGFAQNLANKLGVTVYAPNNYLWANPNGTHFIAGKNSADKPDYSNKGKIVKFTPGGKKK